MPSSLSCFRVVTASSLSGDVVPCRCRPVLVLCRSDDNDNNEQPIGPCSSFGCHVANSDVAPGVVCDHENGNEVMLAHLGWY